MKKIKILKNVSYYYSDGYFTDSNFVIVSELIETNNKEFEKMMLTNTPVQMYNGRVEPISGTFRLKQLVEKYSKDIKDTNELIPLKLMTVANDNKTLVVFYNRQVKRLTYLDKKYLDLFPKPVKLYQSNDILEGCNCSLNNTYLGTIMPVDIRDMILPKELVLVERELMSELDNLEIY